MRLSFQLFSYLVLFSSSESLVLLGIFCALNLIGLSESAGVATGMFGIHLGVMATLVGSCIVFIVRNSAYVWSTMQHNWAIQVL
jgi:hypothetical protein